MDYGILGQGYSLRISNLLAYGGDARYASLWLMLIMQASG